MGQSLTASVAMYVRRVPASPLLREIRIQRKQENGKGEEPTGWRLGFSALLNPTEPHSVPSSAPQKVWL